VDERRMIYGKNEHIVDPPQYHEYLYEVMTEPFFFIQYLAAVIYIIQKLSELAMLLLGSSVITTSINYIMLYISYRKIKEMAEKVV
jgi:cation-transporting ATPase 13A2